MRGRKKTSNDPRRVSTRSAGRAAAVLVISAAVLAAVGGCGTGSPQLTARIATLEGTNLELRDKVNALERELKKIRDDQAEQKTEGMVTCMRILFELAPKWKQRLRLDLLDFSAKDMNVGVMAEADVAEGHINILTGGVTRIWGNRADVLREEHGIWVMHIAGPDDGRAVFRLIQGYNAISKAAIRKKHGKNFLDNVFKPKD